MLPLVDMATYASNHVLAVEDAESEEEEDDPALQDKLDTLLEGLMDAYPDDVDVDMFCRECWQLSPRDAFRRLEQWFTS